MPDSFFSKNDILKKISIPINQLNQQNAKGAKSKVAPPRAGGHKVGVFASRAPYRPNAIGLSLVKILKVDHDNGQIDVENCDLVNETPILGEFNYAHFLNNNFNILRYKTIHTIIRFTS